MSTQIPNIRKIKKLDENEFKEGSNLNLSIIEKLSNKDLFEEKLEIISIRSKLNDSAIKNIISKSINESDNEENSEKITKIIEKSESIQR